MLSEASLTRALRRHDWIPLALLLLGLLVHFGLLYVASSGISGDSARLGLHALDFLRRQVWPFYIYHLFAPNPLIVYLDAVTLTVFGFNIIGICAASAISAALASPAAYLASRELFADHGRRFARRTGVLAAVGLTLSTAFHSYVPYGTEHALLPVLELLAVAALWRGLRRRRGFDFLMAGLLIGASQYAYIVARAFPLALAVAFGLALLVQRDLWQRWRGLALTAGTAVLVSLPQWAMFIRTPYTFVARTEQAAGRIVFGLPNPGPILLTKLINQFLMLGLRWDNSSHPGRPLLDPVLFLCLLVAVAVTLRGRRASLVFGALLAALMMVPELITYEGLSPFPTRIVGAMPLLILLAGSGGAVIWGWLERRPKLPAWSGRLILAAVILAGLERQWDYMFRVTPARYASQGFEWSASLVEIAEADYITRHQQAPVLILSSEYQRPPLALLLAANFPERRGLPSTLQAGEPITVIEPSAPDRPTSDGIPSRYLPDEWVVLDHGTAYFLPPLPGSVARGVLQQSIFAGNGVLAARVFSARWQGGQPALEPVTASFTNGLDLVGSHHTAFTPGQPLTVTLYWRPRQTIADDEQVFVQILDRGGNAIAAVHDWPLHGVYRIAAWRPGEVMPLSYQLNMPPDVGPGPYRLVAGVWDVVRQARLALVSGGDVATAASLKVPLPPATAAPAQAVSAEFQDGIELPGYTLTETAGAVHLSLFWQATQSPSIDYTVFVHIVDAAGNIAGQSDSEPLKGQYPTSIWSPGETVMDERTIFVPTGEYQVFAGLYRLDTGERLPVRLRGARVPDDRLSLGWVRVP